MDSLRNLALASLVIFSVFSLTNIAPAQVVTLPAGTRADYTVGRYPNGIAFDNITNSVWVTNKYSSTVSKVNINDGTIIGNYPVGYSPIGVAFDNITNSVWVANSYSNTVSKVDINTGTIIGNYPVGSYPNGVVFDSVTNSVWVTNGGSNTVSKVNINDGSIIGNYPVGSYPSGITFDSVTNSIWVVNRYSNTISKVDINMGTSIDYGVGLYPLGIAFDNITNSVWVTNFSTNTISKVDISTGIKKNDYPAGGYPNGIAFDNVTNSVWVTNYYSSTVSKVDINRGTRIGYPARGGPSDIAFDNVTNSVWVANSYANTVSKFAIGDPVLINTPPSISSPAQFKSDGMTAIAGNGITTEPIVVFKAILADAENDQVKLQVELKESSQAFDGVVILESGFIASGANATTTKDLIPEGQYHWRARAMDDKGNVSEWQEFGTAGNIDFEVKIPLSYKAANLAKELVNQPYLWGGKGWDYNQSLFTATNAIKTGYQYYNPYIKSVGTGIGVDCSGLVMWSYDRSFDPNKSRFDNFVKAEGADEQYRYNTATTTESQLQKGDVMFFDWDGNNFMDHVAMYVGESGGYDVVSASSRTIGIVARSKDAYKLEPGFVAFKKVISALPLVMLATAHSPVNLILTDPDGLTITATTTIPSDAEYLREIPGELYYSEMEKGIDGNPIDQVYSYVAKTGDYVIKVVPAKGSMPTETYTLDFKIGEQAIILAKDVLLSQIPRGGYGVSASATGAIGVFTPVSIDIKPNDYPNSINLGSNGTTPIAILGSSTFDVTQINLTTIKLENTAIKLKNNSKPMVDYEDVNGDSIVDIVAHFTTSALQLTSSAVKVNLEGQLNNGTRIKGFDSVNIVP